MRKLKVKLLRAILPKSHESLARLRARRKRQLRLSLWRGIFDQAAQGGESNPLYDDQYLKLFIEGSRQDELIISVGIDSSWSESKTQVVWSVWKGFVKRALSGHTIYVIGS